MNRTWARLRQEPYRLLFPLGLGCAVVGLGVWIPYYFLPEALPYPGQAHAVIQIQGFLLCFIFGFLCTMLPKVLGVPPLGSLQCALFPLLLSGIAAAALAGFPRLSQIPHLLLLLNFIAFIAARWPKRLGNPPPQFIFIALAMASDLAGTVLRLLPPEFAGPGARMGILLQYQAFPLLLILGVGGFLLPKLFGAAVLDPESIRSQPRKPFHALLAWGLVFLFSYGLEAWGPHPWTFRLACSARAAVWAWFLFFQLRLHRIPRGLPAYLAGARFSLYAIGLGFMMPVFFPAYRVAWEHMVFITGILWLTLSIAARVAAAHGGRLEILGKHRRQTLGYGLLLVLAMASRVSTDIWTGGHWLHLALASAFALAALALWARIYVPLFRLFPGSG